MIQIDEAIPLKDYWDNYWKDRSTENRNKLVEAYLPVVEVVAKVILRGLPNTVSYDDLYSSGVVGLIDAVERFDGVSCKFETFASQRIRGSIFDEIRNTSYVGRRMNERLKEIEEIYDFLKKKLGRSPLQNEVNAELINRKNKNVNANFVSFVPKFNECCSDLEREQLDIDPLSGEDIEVIDFNDMIDTLLNDREKRCVHMLYYDGLMVKDVAKAEGTTTNPVRAVLSKARQKLYECLVA